LLADPPIAHQKIADQLPLRRLGRALAYIAPRTLLHIVVTPMSWGADRISISIVQLVFDPCYFLVSARRNNHSKQDTQDQSNESAQDHRQELHLEFRRRSETLVKRPACCPRQHKECGQEAANK
jgi:hypothetical protein